MFMLANVTCKCKLEIHDPYRIYTTSFVDVQNACFDCKLGKQSLNSEVVLNLMFQKNRITLQCLLKIYCCRKVKLFISGKYPHT